MQKFTIESIQVDEDGQAQPHSESDAFYPAAMVDAEIALLKAEIEGLVNDHNLKDCDIERMRAEAELIKAALRWCVKWRPAIRNGALVFPEGVGFTPADPPGLVELLQEVAVIAEAVGEKQ